MNSLTFFMSSHVPGARDHASIAETVLTWARLLTAIRL
ncbi:hypothetical protein KR50_33930 [Jeotgalibacillus campisalis]|uniref:Uncharacterized protein n=1 Tax=Jeotgalibacillus campisalis TaxID=220754 RepID=A0A0C2QY89_9BACL|nr:hypothetical protein KR50_33930 [Jeotgalibacillus campisalis]